MYKIHLATNLQGRNMSCVRLMIWNYRSHVLLYYGHLLHAEPIFRIYNNWHSVIGITIHLKPFYDIAAYIHCCFPKESLNHNAVCKRYATFKFHNNMFVNPKWRQMEVHNRIILQLRVSYISCVDVIKQNHRTIYFAMAINTTI